MKQLAEAHGIDPDRQPPAHAPQETDYDCDPCRDTGWTTREDGGNGTAVQCPCSDPAKNPRLLRGLMGSAGMETGEIDAAFGDWDERAGESPKPTFARRWLVWAMSGCDPAAMPVDLETMPINPRLLTLLGLPGTGKTKTLGVVLRLYIGYGGRGALWARVPEAFDLVQQQRFEGSSAYEDRIKAAQILFLDELGVAHRAKKELIADTVHEWINYRERRSRITAITTNAENLGDLGDGRLEDRLASGIYRLMKGPSYRDQGAKGK